MKKALMLALGALAVIAAIVFWDSYRMPPPAPDAERQLAPKPAKKPIHYPIPAARPAAKENEAVDAETEPLPALQESDQRMRDVLFRLFPGQKLDDFFVLDNFIQRLVVMIDNLPRRELPVNKLPTRPVAEKFQVTVKEETLAIDPANYRRYTPWIRLAEAVDPQQAVAAYVRLYPLFQQAYAGLGYPGEYFNDRLIEVIDHLLATPEVSGTIQLVRPKVVYLYADPDLEALSAGQKILVRIGPENAARIKEVMRACRRELTITPETR